MNLSQQRADLAETLKNAAADLTINPYVPEMVSPPAIIIEPSDPYLTIDDDTPFGHWTIAYDLLAVVEVGTNEKATEDLDNLITAVATALKGAYAVSKVSQPFGYQSNTVVHLATTITVTDTTDLTTE